MVEEAVSSREKVVDEGDACRAPPPATREPVAAGGDATRTAS